MREPFYVRCHLSEITRLCPHGRLLSARPISQLMAGYSTSESNGTSLLQSNTTQTGSDLKGAVGFVIPCHLYIEF